MSDVQLILNKEDTTKLRNVLSWVAQYEVRAPIKDYGHSSVFHIRTQTMHCCGMNSIEGLYYGLYDRIPWMDVFKTIKNHDRWIDGDRIVGWRIHDLFWAFGEYGKEKEAADYLIEKFPHLCRRLGTWQSQTEEGHKTSLLYIDLKGKL